MVIVVTSELIIWCDYKWIVFYSSQHIILSWYLSIVVCIFCDSFFKGMQVGLSNILYEI